MGTSKADQGDGMILAQTQESTSAAWFTLAGALGGVFLTSVVAIITAILNHRWQKDNVVLTHRFEAEDSDAQLAEERRKALRQERREAYAHYWASFYAYQGALDRLVDLQDATAKDHNLITKQLQLVAEIEVASGDAAGSALLIAGDQVLSALTDLQGALQDSRKAILDQPVTQSPSNGSTGKVTQAGFELLTAMRNELSL